MTTNVSLAQASKPEEMTEKAGEKKVVSLTEEELDSLLMRIVALEEKVKCYEGELERERSVAESALKEAEGVVVKSLEEQKKILLENGKVKQQLYESLQMNSRLHELLDIAVKEISAKEHKAEEGQTSAAAEGVAKEDAEVAHSAPVLAASADGRSGREETDGGKKEADYLEHIRELEKENQMLQTMIEEERDLVDYAIERLHASGTGDPRSVSSQDGQDALDA